MSEKPGAAAAASFEGEVLAVKARIRLLRSFDETSHNYQGYTLVLRGVVDGISLDRFKVAIGPAAQEKHQLRRFDRLTGKATPVQNRETEWADYYKASGLRVLSCGPDSEKRPADPEGGLAPPLPDYRARGHRRLDPTTCETACAACPFGLVMPTEITLDKRTRETTWRFETHCYGPRDCPRYVAGPPYRVPGREPGREWIDHEG